jgi:hypothetical protein
MSDEPIPAPVAGDPVVSATPEPVVADPAAKPTPVSDQDWYWKRQHDKAQKELADAEAKAKELTDKVTGFESEKMTELERKEKETADAKAEADTLRKENAKLKAIGEAELPPELASLVPDGLDDPATYILEKIMPLKDKLVTGKVFGTPTAPSHAPMPDANQQIIDTFKAMQARNESDAKLQEYYNEHHEVLKVGLSQIG